MYLPADDHVVAVLGAVGTTRHCSQHDRSVLVAVLHRRDRHETLEAEALLVHLAARAGHDALVVAGPADAASLLVFDRLAAHTGAFQAQAGAAGFAAEALWPVAVGAGAGHAEQSGIDKYF